MIMGFEDIVSGVSLRDFSFLFIIVRLFLLGAVTFLAILTWTKDRNIHWSLIVGGVVFYFINSVLDMFVRVGVLHYTDFSVLGFPIIPFVSTVLPPFFFFLAFLLKILKR